MSAECPPAGVYRPRNPRSTPLYRLVETHYDEVKGQWEERFEGRYGYWRGFVDGVVQRYLDCGVFRAGFARVRCPGCAAEFLVACSCRGRGFCPSCGAKRAAEFSALLSEDVLEPVCHRMWTFTLPRMLRPYFLHHRELLGKLCRAAYETVQELMASAAIGVEGFRTGMVAAVHLCGDLLTLNPHVHALAPRGGWAPDGSWVPVPFVDERCAELLFRKKVLKLLSDQGLLSEERQRLLLSWRHRTGFSADASVKVEPEDEASLKRLARYILRPPVSLERMAWGKSSGDVVYTRKPAKGRPGGSEHIDPLDFLARVIAYIPDPRRHTVFYFAWYSNVSRGRRRKGRDPELDTHTASDELDVLPPAARQARRRAWARLIKLVYEVSPLTCPRCGSEMKVISVILDPAVIDRILDHLASRGIEPGRGPPREAAAVGF
jgi:hypothetical protein